MLTALGY